MTEQVFFDGNGIKVTQSRFIVTGQTYTMASVSSVKVDVKEFKPSTLWPYLAILVGLFIIIGNLSKSDIGSAILGLLVVAAGIWWRLSLKAKHQYALVLTTSAGEKQALNTADKDFIEQVHSALIEAIVVRG